MTSFIIKKKEKKRKEKKEYSVTINVIWVIDKLSYWDCGNATIRWTIRNAFGCPLIMDKLL